MFAALDWIGVHPHETKHAGRRRLNAITEQLGVAGDGRIGRGERLDDGEGDAGGAARGVDGELGRVLQAVDARAVLSPGREAFLPERRLAGGEFGRALTLATCIVFVVRLCQRGGSYAGNLLFNAR